MMQFNIKRKGQKERLVEFKEIEEIMAFIMGLDAPVKITPDWQSRAWDLEVLENDEGK